MYTTSMHVLSIIKVLGTHFMVSEVGLVFACVQQKSDQENMPRNY